MRTRSQRLLSMVLALSMLLTFLPVSAFADDTPPPYVDPQELDTDNTYTYKDNNNNEYKYKYTLNDNGTATLTKFTGTDAKVPKEVTKGTKTYKVTTIGAEAFINHSDTSALSSVTLPDSIQTIEYAAFHGCFSLHKITLREGLTTVGNAAFAMAGLTEVTLPKSLKKVGDSAFGSVPTAIKTVTYTSTEEDWDKLVHSAEFGDYNTQLIDATLHCAHTVTFDVGGHGTAPDQQEVQYEGYAEKPADPEENGYTFKYWFTKSENGEEKEFDFGTKITKDETLFAHWEAKKTDPAPTTPPESTDKTDNNKTDTDKSDTQEKPNEPTPPEAPAVEEDDTAAIGYAAAAVTAAFVGWGAYRIGSEVYLKYLLPKDVLLPQNRLQLAELLWEDAGRPAPADAASYADVDANDADARQAARWAVENGLLTLPDAEKPEEFAPYRSVSYAKSARAWNKAQQLKENAAR